MQNEHNQPLLQVTGLTKSFKSGRHVIAALNGVSLILSSGEVLGIGGESGCGKSTLGKVILRLIEPSSGSIRFEGKELLNLSQSRLRVERQNMQMIFQNPGGSFNPRFNVKEILSEPFIIHRSIQEPQRSERIKDLLDQVGLERHFLERYVHELSGGQKQRIAIARALALNPRLIICDEPFSALDASIQVQIIRLLEKLQKELGLAYILISHDLSAMRSFTDRMVIMYFGQIVETGPSRKVYDQPLHPYTQALISAIPLPNPQLERLRKPIVLKGEMPSLLKASKGCPFQGRCPKAIQICKEVSPALKEINPGHFTACHLSCGK